MNEQLTLQSTQREETKTVPLRRRKACLMGTFALFAACALVLLIPHPAYAGVIGDFLDIPNMLKTCLLQIAATLFNTYFGVIIKTIAVLITTMMGLVKSGSWAKEILGA